MRTIIAGSRNITDWVLLEETIAACGWTPSVVISGGARGIDRLGEIWAECHKVPCEKYLADWNLHGKAAGYKRNEEMAAVAEALLAIWDGNSRGTKHMIDIATRKGLRVHVQKYSNF